MKEKEFCKSYLDLANKYEALLKRRARIKNMLNENEGFIKDVKQEIEVFKKSEEYKNFRKGESNESKQK